jgi:hypothetical protein
VKQRLVLLACLALGFSAGPALAFKNIEGCDIVTFAAKGAPIALPQERWQSYRDQAGTILAAAPGADATLTEWRALANELIEAQKSLLEPEKGSKPYQDYLAGESCLVLARLDAAAVEGLLEEVAQSAPEAAATALRRVTQAARMQIDNIERSARFRSNRDKTAMAAQYYCFVAGAIVALLPPERQQAIALEGFGHTIACKTIGRIE